MGCIQSKGNKGNISSYIIKTHYDVNIRRDKNSQLINWYRYINNHIFSFSDKSDYKSLYTIYNNVKFENDVIIDDKFIITSKFSYDKLIVDETYHNFVILHQYEITHLMLSGREDIITSKLIINPNEKQENKSNRVLNSFNNIISNINDGNERNDRNKEIEGYSNVYTYTPSAPIMT